MPILNVQFAGQGKLPDGTAVPIPPQGVLTQRSPIVQVTVSVGQQIATQVLQGGGTLPPPVSGLALIDTGASVTCVDQDAANQLQLPAIDVVQIASASHAAAEQNVYPIQIEVMGLRLRTPAQRRRNVLEWWVMGWWPGTESNRRHADFQSAALPAELPGQRGDG